jgi:hypothetical protein
MELFINFCCCAWPQGCGIEIGTSAAIICCSMRFIWRDQMTSGVIRNFYLILPHCMPRTFPEKAIVTQLVKELNSLRLWNPKFHFRIHNIPPLVPILSHMNLFYTFPPCFPKVHFNIILPSTPRPSDQHFVCTSHVSHACYMPQPFSCSFFICRSWFLVPIGLSLYSVSSGKLISFCCPQTLVNADSVFSSCMSLDPYVVVQCARIFCGPSCAFHFRRCLGFVVQRGTDFYSCIFLNFRFSTRLCIFRVVMDIRGKTVTSSWGLQGYDAG